MEEKPNCLKELYENCRGEVNIDPRVVLKDIVKSLDMMMGIRVITRTIQKLILSKATTTNPFSQTM